MTDWTCAEGEVTCSRHDGVLKCKTEGGTEVTQDALATCTLKDNDFAPALQSFNYFCDCRGDTCYTRRDGDFDLDTSKRAYNCNFDNTCPYVCKTDDDGVKTCGYVARTGWDCTHASNAHCGFKIDDIDKDNFGSYRLQNDARNSGNYADKTLPSCNFVHNWSCGDANTATCVMDDTTGLYKCTTPDGTEVTKDSPHVSSTACMTRLVD